MCYIFEGKTGNIITLTQFEEEGLLSETHDYADSSEKYDNESIMTPLISKEEMGLMDSCDEYEGELMSTEILEDIIWGSKSHPSVNRREAHYKIQYWNKLRQKRQTESKGALLSTQNMVKVLHIVFKANVNEILQVSPILGEFG